MNLENSKKISLAAPSLFLMNYTSLVLTNDNGDIIDVPFCFECGDGWADLLYEAAVRLNEHIQTLPEEVREDIVVLQVKEKFGTLRLYVSYYTEKIEEIIKEAEDKSKTTCETCGKAGMLRGSVWFYTACDEHTREEDLQDLSQEELP
jgi:hypothetical protein